MTSPTDRLRRGAGALAFLAVITASCSGVDRDVQVPGAAPVMVPADGRGEAVFTRARSETETVVVASTSVDSTVAPATVPTTTTPTTTTPAAGVPPTVEPAVSGWAAFDQHLMTVLEAGSAAVSATVLRDGEVVHEVALGHRTSVGDAVQIGDRYRIASISKVVTTITLLRLVEQSVIGLDDPVGRRLADRVGVSSPVAGVEQITLRQLLTHRSGIAQYENLMFRRQVESCEQAAASGLSRGLERAPGTTLRYSNLNFCLAGLVIEDLTGMAYGEVVERELLAPLGIDGMRLAGTFDVRDGDVEHRSDAGRNYMEVLGAAGSWIASPTDVAMIVNSLDSTTPGWKPLSAPMLAAMAEITADPPLPPVPPQPIVDEAGNVIDAAPAPTTTVTPPPPTRGYGMGLMIFGPDSFGHTGTLESTHAMTAHQADGITWAITVSGDNPSSTRDLAGIVTTALRFASPM